jgi:hypothetical protein
MDIIAYIYTFRDAWKNFEGFPQKSATLAYVYLASQLPGADPLAAPPKDTANSSMGNSVSTFVW